MPWVALLVLVAASLTFASAAQARRLHGDRVALRWGAFTSRALRAAEARPSHLTAAEPAVAGTGSIEGTVRDAVKRTGIAGIEVCAYALGLIEEDEEGAAPCSRSSAGGVYEITGLAAGEYIVEFSSPANSGLNYITQFYEDESSYQVAKPVAVNAEQKTERINAAMAVGAEIEGTVTSGTSGAPSDDALVCAYEESEEALSCAATTSSGDYTIAGLPTGSYTVTFLAEGPAEYYDEVFSESEATPVTVTAPGGVALNVNAVLPVPPKRIVAPRVVGNPAVGGILTCEEGTYGGVPAPTLSVEWLREGEAIAGATSTTYTIQAADAGHELQCKVTATNLMGWLWVKTAGVPIPVPPASAPPVTPPSPAGGVLGNITVVPLVTAASRVISSHRRTTIRLRCSGGPCVGTLHLLLRVVRHHHATILVLANGSFSLQAGTSSSVVMHLTAAGRSHLAHAAHRAVEARLKVKLKDGATTTRAVSTT